MKIAISMNHLTAAEMIAIKRDGGALSQQMISDIVCGITDLSLSDAQVGAFAMAVRIRGMNIDETVQLTDATHRRNAQEWHKHYVEFGRTSC